MLVNTATNDSHQLLHARHKWPLPSDEIAELVTDRAERGHIQDFYTDGSCFFPRPRSQATRDSAFSILLDVNLHDDERLEALRQPLFQPELSFSLCCLGRPQHERDIYRAELTAVTIVATWNMPRRIWCDNQAVCQMCLACQKARHTSLSVESA